MTRNSLNLRLDANFCFAFLIWAFAVEARAAGSAPTNQSAPLEVALRTPVLTNAEQVHWLTRKEAAGGHHAVIRGVITCSLPQTEGAIIQDATSGIYINHLNPSLGEPPAVGELVEV